jgi:hypothetical protein
MDHLAKRFAWYRQARGVWLGLLAFAAMNLGVLIAQETVLFWMPYYPGAVVDNYAQFEIKRHLLPENGNMRQIILVGNSAVCSNFDERQMNVALRNKVWMTELHQSGICGLDLRFIVDDLEDVHAYCAVTYVSTAFFNGLPNGLATTHFLKFSEIPDLLRTGSWKSFPEGSLRAGVIGKLVPLYRQNKSVSRLLLGSNIKNLAQMRFDASLETNLDVQARRRAPSLETSPRTEMQRRGFDEAMERLSKRCEHIVIVVGTSYPLIDELRADLRPKMLSDLAALQKRCPNIILLHQEELMQVTKADYIDLVHFNEPAQMRFSERFCEWLTNNLLTKD